MARYVLMRTFSVLLLFMFPFVYEFQPKSFRRFLPNRKIICFRGEQTHVTNLARILICVVNDVTRKVMLQG